jgi:hypothetical protein
MKTLITSIIVAMALASCSTVKEQGNVALNQAKTGASIGFVTEKVEKGYQVSGHASTNVFGIEPYGSFKAGIRYAPRQPVETVVPFEPALPTK